MKKVLFLLLIISPIVVSGIVNYFGKKTEEAITDTLYFGKRTSDEKVFLRGEVVKVSKESRVLTIRVMNNYEEIVSVPKETVFYLKLKVEKGGFLKKISGDYFNRITKGELMDIEMAGDSPFAKQILIYDLESFKI